MEKVLHETCPQYVARRLSEGWRITKQEGFLVILESPEGILRPVDLRNDTETLRPDATGDENSIAYPSADPTTHWNLVDEASADDDTTYVYTMSETYERDLYNLPASGVGSGVINFIKIYCRCKAANYQGYAKPSLKSNSTVTDGTEVALTTDNVYTTLSQQWNTNPADSAAWSWADIDALQIGVSLKAHADGNCKCTQVYVEIDWSEAPPAVGRSYGYIIG